jgi:hypothetical protein
MVINPGTVALIASLLSTAASGYNQYRTAKRTEDQALEGMNAQRMKQRQMDERLNAGIDELEQSTPEDEQAASLDAYMSQLRANRGSIEGDSVPGVSRYGQDTATSQAGVQNYGQRVAGILSRLDATRDQRRNEGFGISRMATDVDGTAREARGDDFINRLRMSQIQPNVWMDAGSQVLGGVASGMSAYAANQPDPMTGLSEVNVTARRAPPMGVWAGATSTQSRLPRPGQRVG